MRVLAYLFHPVFILLYGTLVLFNTHTFLNFSIDRSIKQMVYLTILINTIILPLIMTLYMWRKSYIESLDMRSLDDRKWMYFFTLVIYIATVFFLRSLPLPSLIIKFVFGACASIGVLFMVSFFGQKWSAHLLGLGGLTGVLIAAAFRLSVDLTPLIALSILVAGLLGVQRLLAKAHIPREVYLGYLSGLCIQLMIHL